MSKEIVKSSSGSYSRPIGTTYPGLIMLLLDQSASMSDNNKANLAATAVNRVIYEIMLASRSGEQINDRCFVGVVGYGASIEPVVGGSISQVAANPIELEQVDKHDGAGGLVKMELPIWVKPKAEDGTPMAEAMEKAYTLIETWARKNPDSFPPVVINVTDGEPNDFDKNTGDAPRTREAARRLMGLGTSDGQSLLFNAHISGASAIAAEIQLPHSDAGIRDPYARLLFSISSVLPPPLMVQAQKAGFSPQPGARGMVFNASAETLIKLLIFGSSFAR